MILKCEACKDHGYQDGTYGHGMRVMNKLDTSGGKVPSYRCTVCTATRAASTPPSKKGK